MARPMRYLFIHQNFPGQFRHVAGALAARGHEVVALGVNKTAEPVSGVRHVLYRERSHPPVDASHALDGSLGDTCAPAWAKASDFWMKS